MQETLDALREIGLSKPEVKIALITDEPKYPGFLCFPTGDVEEEYSTDGAFGQGFDPDETTARVKSIGEFLERLCLMNVSGTIIPGRFGDNPSFVDPALFCTYSDAQVDKARFLEEARHAAYRWTPVHELSSGVQAHVPTQMISLDHALDDEFPIRGERISTGAAFGRIGTQRAFVSGLMESLERDACISAYLMQRPVKRIVGLDGELGGMIDYFGRYRLEPHLFDVTTDLGVPTVMAIVLDRTGIGAAVNIGSRAALTYHDAIRGALLESIHCRRTSRMMKQRQWPDRLPGEDEITSMDNRFYYWHGTERIDDLAFWLGSENEMEFSSLAPVVTDTGSVLATLKERGYHVFVADITLPAIREGGFEAKKVLIPQLHALYLDERAKGLHSDHFGDIPEHGLKPHPLT